jgi:hypothetical protein
MSRSAAWRWLEALAILLALASLWPWILGFTNPLWKLFMYVMLGVMLVLFAANARRIWRIGRSKPQDRP